VQRFIERLPATSPVAQVMVTRLNRGFELRHVEDSNKPADQLRVLGIPDLRELARFNAAGQFRPIKAAPDLRTGWRCVALDADQLERALEELYPGFLADWHAVESGFPPITHFRPFAARQTGIYLQTTNLGDEQAGAVVRACCAARFCLKRRWWTVRGLAPDEASAKSIIPCLEPCALLLDLARLAASEDGEAARRRSGSELQQLAEVVEKPDATVATADLAHPNNPRHARWLIECNALVLANASRPA
jgi:hypothetical protein